MLKIDELAEITFERIRTGIFYERGPRALKCPSVKVLGEIFEVLFFASLKTEEGRPIQVRVFYMDPDNPDPQPPPRIRSNRWKASPLATRIKLTTKNLVKFAKAADAWSTGVAIFNHPKDGLQIWGLVDQVLHLSTSLVREIEGTYIQPGAFHAVINGPADITVLKETTFIARLAQDSLITEQNDCFFHGPVGDLIDKWVNQYSKGVFRSLNDEIEESKREMFEERARYNWVRTLSRILIHIQRQHHGGAVLITTKRPTDLSVKHRIQYRRLLEGFIKSLFYGILLSNVRDKYFSRRAAKHRTMPIELHAEMSVLESECEDADKMMAGAVRFVSSFAALDGLIWMSPSLIVKGFGTIIETDHLIDTVDVVSGSNGVPEPVRLDSFGTRHGSMIRYCDAHPGSLGLVISQDGDIRAITKVGERCTLFDNVQVHDVESHLPKSRRDLDGKLSTALRAKIRPTLGANEKGVN